MVWVHPVYLRNSEDRVVPEWTMCLGGWVEDEERLVSAWSGGFTCSWGQPILSPWESRVIGKAGWSTWKIVTTNPLITTGILNVPRKVQIQFSHFVYLIYSGKLFKEFCKSAHMLLGNLFSILTWGRDCVER